MFECGMETESWCDMTAFRIRVNMSDMGSVTGISVNWEVFVVQIRTIKGWLF